MLTNIFLAALIASPLIAAHGRVSVIVSHLRRMINSRIEASGGVIPGARPNSKTEVDTTPFSQLNPASNDLGKTKGQGENTLQGMSAVVAMSGSTLPQVSQGGNLPGILPIVTTNGAGSLYWYVISSLKPPNSCF